MSQYFVLTMIDHVAHATFSHLLQHSLVHRPSVPSEVQSRIMATSVARILIRHTQICGISWKDEPDILLFTNFPVRMDIFCLRKKVFVLNLRSQTVALLHHRKAFHTGFVQMQAAACPYVVYSIHESLVKERIVRRFRHTHLLSLNALGASSVDVICSECPIATVVHKSWSDLHVEKPVGMSEVLALGHV